MRIDKFDLPKRGGGLLVDKPVGPTSHDVVKWTRKVLGTRRVGHTGTLDPFASGLLILLFGPATRLAEYLSCLPKTYEASARLGIRTDTHDSQGRVIEPLGNWEMIGRNDLFSELMRFQGKIKEVPPQFSAKKISGEAMYKKARRGEKVELDPVVVEIFDIQLTAFDPPEFSFEVTCSAGTYIRALARDLGESLGVGAHLISLRRTCVGDFSVEKANPGNILREGRIPNSNQWIEAAEMICHLPSLRVDTDVASQLRQGCIIQFPESDLKYENHIAVIDDIGLLGIAEMRDGELVPKKILQGPVKS